MCSIFRAWRRRSNPRSDPTKLFTSFTVGRWPPPERAEEPSGSANTSPPVKDMADPADCGGANAQPEAGDLRDEVRKGKVLRRVDYVEPERDPEYAIFRDGPRAVFAVDIDDEDGKDVWKVDQAITTDAALVRTGDPVIVTFQRRPGTRGQDRTTLRVDWSRVRP